MKNWLLGAAITTAVAFSLVTPAFGDSAPLSIPENTSSPVVSPGAGFPASATATRYLCQKKDACGRWQTVCVVYSLPNAYAWYDKQPSNARIVAEK